MKNESGRSMVEMLGVLAIIGVLSIGGIAGYTLAMNRYKANEGVNLIGLAGIYGMTANGGEGQNTNFYTSSDVPTTPTGYTQVKLSTALGTTSFPSGMKSISTTSAGVVTATYNKADWKIGKLAADILNGGKLDATTSTCDGISSQPASDCTVVANMGE